MPLTDIAPDVMTALSLRFQIAGELGRGGMGTVLKGHDRELGREVAIKVLPLALSRDLGADRFTQEIRVTARLVHPNIVPLFSSGEAAGTLYYVMPLIEGSTLRQRLSGGPLNPAQVRRIVGDLAESLAYAHASGVLHRDLKPENVFWYQERAMLADFGIARPLDQAGGAHFTQTGMVVGTLDYISPEQCGGDPDIDGRSDLYSLGCVAFELLTGRPPFGGRSAAATITAHLTTPPPDVREQRPDVSPRLASLIQRLMAKERAHRPATGAALLDELRAIDSGTASITIVDLPAASAPAAPGLPADVVQLMEQGHALYTASVQGGAGARNKLEMAKVYYEKALARVPGSAPVMVALADAIFVMGVRGFADLEASHREARDMRLRALAIDDSIGPLHTSLGTTFLYWEDEFEMAGVELKRGVELSPRNALGRRLYGAWLKIAARIPEALEEMRAAVSLAPDAPFMRVGLADVLMTLGRYDEAAGPLRDALRLSPKYDAALERLEMSCHRAGLHDEALDARRSILGVRGETARLQSLMDEVESKGWPVAREADLRRELQRLLEKSQVEDPFLDVAGSRQLSDKLIIVLAELGEWSRAMDWVEQGYHRRPGRLRRVLMDLPYNRHGLAVDPRYARLLRTAGLADLM